MDEAKDFLRPIDNRSVVQRVINRLTKDESNSLGSLKELREWMDWGILRLATLKANELDIVALEKRFEELKSALEGGDINRIFDADNKFHLALNEAAHNSLFF